MTTRPPATPTALSATATATVAEGAAGSRSDASRGPAASDRAMAFGRPHLGRVLAGRYRLDRVLGSGGLAVVFESTQLDLGRKVAVKLMRRDRKQDTKLLARLKLEARTVALIDHPNVVELYDIGETPEGEVFLVMELIRGETLTALLAREGALVPARAERLAEQILSALAEVHARGLVHRDLKPGNLMVRQTATGDDHVTLLDFGIVKTRSDDLKLTQTGCIVGSPMYIAPEQVRGDAVSARTDLYQLGCVLHEMLTGRRVFDAKTPVDAVLAHIHKEAPMPTVDGVVVEGALAELAMLCLRKAASERPPTARACLKLLRFRRATAARPASRPSVRQRCVSAPGATRRPISVIVPAAAPAPRSAGAQERPTVLNSRVQSVIESVPGPARRAITPPRRAITTEQVARTLTAPTPVLVLAVTAVASLSTGAGIVLLSAM